MHETRAFSHNESIVLSAKQIRLPSKSRTVTTLPRDRVTQDGSKRSGLKKRSTMAIHRSLYLLIYSFILFLTTLSRSFGLSFFPYQRPFHFDCE